MLQTVAEVANKLPHEAALNTPAQLSILLNKPDTKQVKTVKLSDAQNQILDRKLKELENKTKG